MRLREKLTVEEKVAIALELIKRERSLDQIQERYRVSHTTAYKLRNQFLEGDDARSPVASRNRAISRPACARSKSASSAKQTGSVTTHASG